MKMKASILKCILLKFFEEDPTNNDIPFQPDNRNLDESIDSLCAEEAQRWGVKLFQNKSQKMMLKAMRVQNKVIQRENIVLFLNNATVLTNNYAI